MKKKKGCDFCKLPKEYEKFIIKDDYKNWIVDLSIDQYFPGKCIVRLKRHLEDVFDLNKNEREELFFISKRIRNVIRKLFHPIHFNYKFLGNSCRHVHLHLIPRYRKQIKIGKFTFQDQGWKNGKLVEYLPTRKQENRIKKETKIIIKNKIKENLK